MIIGIFTILGIIEKVWATLARQLIIPCPKEKHSKSNKCRRNLCADLSVDAGGFDEIGVVGDQTPSQQELSQSLLDL